LNVESPDHVWRPALTLRVFAWVWIGGYPVVFIVVMATQLRRANGEPGAAFLTMLLFLPPTAFFWLYILRPWIAADSESVTVRNPMTIRRFRYPDITAAKPGYHGIAIRTRSGRGIVAVAVQKSNLSWWTNREVRADRVARFIEERSTGLGT
jgi:hypothetical protein